MFSHKDAQVSCSLIRVWCICGCVAYASVRVLLPVCICERDAQESHLIKTKLSEKVNSSNSVNLELNGLWLKGSKQVLFELEARDKKNV